MMVRLLGWCGAFSVAALSFGTGLVAQQPPAAERLRQQVMQRFLETYRVQAALTPEQRVRFEQVFRRSIERREELQRRQRELWQALEVQMRPGVAADPDSVSKLMDGLIELGAAMLEQTRAEQRDYAAFLNPVQRAQWFIMWERFQRQIEQVRRRMMPP
jgi:predicted phage gp36 major capsid-like protein